MEAIREHGAVAGSVLAFKRICRCNPFAECGHDPVPPVILTLTPLERGLDPR
jgi:putative component of membrane protein insertase Oxa1/YidC/SpoIIIJ protein YidD